MSSTNKVTIPLFRSHLPEDDRINGSVVVVTGEDEDSMSEPETDPDTQSTTSYEDFSKLHPDMLLYKAARARNLPVMREALALGADPNWQNEEEHHQTPLMKAIASVSVTRNVCHVYFF